jgi:RNA polymerase sigma-70 factor (ECF subfamily)
MMPLSTRDSPPSEPGRAPPSAALVAQARQGDDRALEVLFGSYYEQVSLYLIRLVGDDEVGHELAQETFLKAWQALPGLREEARFVGWLYRIATNLARDHQRRARLIRWLPWDQYQQREEAQPTGRTGPETQVEEAELLKQALAQVSLTYRACLVLYIVEDLPQPAIAERLGIKPSSVSNYVSRGLAELRRVYLRLAAEQPRSDTGGVSHE